MIPPSRYSRGVRRSSLFSILGLSTLVSASVLVSEPSLAEDKKKDTPAAKADDKKPAPKAELKDVPKADDKKSDDKPKEDPVERARRGVVTIERAGEVVGLGTVLGEDGRVLTALSPLSDGNNLALRYADGSTVKAKVGHSSRLWDMAMLVPQVGKWGEGLSAGSADPLQQKALKSFSPGKGKAQSSPIAFKGRKSFLGADDQMLGGALEVGSKLGARELGSPVIDDQGNVVAMIGRACVPVENGPCLPSPIGVPVPAIRHFLSSAPPNAVRPAPWLGLRGAAEKADKGNMAGVRVLGVQPESPADEAGLKGGADKAASDLIVAVDDVPVQSPEALSRAIQGHAVGDRVKMLVLRQGKLQENTVVLQAPPPASPPAPPPAKK